jgi:hypothetical protein
MYLAAVSACRYGILFLSHNLSDLTVLESYSLQASQFPLCFLSLVAPIILYELFGTIYWASMPQNRRTGIYLFHQVQMVAPVVAKQNIG